MTGVAVTAGVVVKDEAPADSVASSSSIDVVAAAQQEAAAQEGAAARVEAAAMPLAVQPVAETREQAPSRSDRRTSLEKQQVVASQESGNQVTRTEDLADQDPRDIARQLLPEFGFSASDFSCLDSLWVSESDWDVHADNPISSAYGIPQALTGGTHDNLPADYMTNPVSQIRWGLDYIKVSYGTPCAAWEFKQGNNWY